MLATNKKLWLIAIFSIAIIILVNLVWWVFYGRTERLLDRQMGRRLEAVAKAGAIRINPQALEELLEMNIETFAEVSDILEEIRLTDSLSEVFIIDENYRYLATTSDETDSVYLLAPLNGKYIDSLFYDPDPKAVSSESYQTGGFYLKSAFVPLFEVNGLAVAVLGVEAPVDFFESLKQSRRNLFFSGFLSIIAGLVFGAVFLVLQRSLNRAESQLFLNETHSHLGRMVAVISHEIKNPLTIIRSSGEQIKRVIAKQPDIPGGIEIQRESGFVIEEVDRLNEIVTSYLNFARGTSGGLLVGASPKPMNVDEFIAKIKMYLLGKYPGQNIEWTDSHEKQGLVVSTFERVLGQLILNLLINGAEACLAAQKPIKLGLSIADAGQDIDIRVSDFGAGISKEEQRKLFTPFYSTRHSGTGLGLYLSKKIVDELKGRIDIKSVLGDKTEIIIVLPKQQSL
ncbi:MAG: sensor histidine kinase [Candidatus Zixiibacteriota bacterium]